MAKWYFLALLSLLPASMLHALDAVPLESALVETAPKLIEQLQEKKVKNVGVLKFLVARGKSQSSNNAGVINRQLADRLEVALLLALPNDRIRLLSQATDEAARLKLGSHRTAADRMRFFDYDFTCAWGSDDPHKPDYFITGIANIADDLQTIAITVQGFGRNGEVETLATIDALMDPRLLSESGYSYILDPVKNAAALTRGGLTKEKNQQINNVAREQSTTPVTTKTALVINEPVLPTFEDSPLDVQVLYNDQPVAIKKGRLPEPTASTRVSFQLTNKIDKTLGIVLKVNGENTLFRERSDAFTCHKWILGPKDKVTVTGFQESFEKSNPFVVLPPRQSRENEMDYGSHAGTFQFAIFVGTMSEKEPAPTILVKNEEKTLAAISRGSPTVSKIRPGSLRSLQADLRGREKSIQGTRGLIVAGEQQEQRNVKRVYFQPEIDLPIALLTLRYYQPARSTD